VNRSRIIATALLLAALGALLPLAVAAYASWARAVSQEQSLLDGYATRALRNVTTTLDQGRRVVTEMENWRGTPCSAEHIEQMRRVAINSRYTEQVGYLENGQPRCSSWGVFTSPPGTRRVAPPDADLPDGFRVTLRTYPAITGGDPVTVLQRGNIYVLINTSRLTDVIVDDRVQLGVAYGGKVVSTLRATDTDFVARVASSPTAINDGRYLHAVARQDAWSAVVLEPQGNLRTSLLKELLWLLPIGVIISCVIVALVIRLLRKRLSPLAELNIAVQQREFVVFYQPIIHLTTGACIAAEALVRWRRPDGTMVRPDLFIPLAEESGLILPITDQVVETCIRDLRELLLADRSMHVAINLSANDITTGRFIGVLQKALEGSGILNEQIWLEATERGFVDVDAASANLAKARALGFGIAIDDFGTGYSSLQYLERLPTDALKIDKCFIAAIGRTVATSSVISHIIDMAKTVGLKVVAEGVETEAQAEYLKAHGVEFAQGWLYAKAMPIEDFLAFVRVEAWREAKGAQDAQASLHAAGGG
jgi:sensor c-di-GMP phosphodiesterase-like protein